MLCNCGVCNNHESTITIICKWTLENYIVYVNIHTQTTEENRYDVHIIMYCNSKTI